MAAPATHGKKKHLGIKCLSGEEAAQPQGATGKSTPQEGLRPKRKQGVLNVHNVQQNTDQYKTDKEIIY